MSATAREPSALRGVGSAAYTGLNGTGLFFFTVASVAKRLAVLLRALGVGKAKQDKKLAYEIREWNKIFKLHYGACPSNPINIGLNFDVKGTFLSLEGQKRRWGVDVRS